MKKVIKYASVMDSQVTAKLAEGWELYGSPVYSNEHTIMQAMILCEETDKEGPIKGGKGYDDSFEGVVPQGLGARGA